jgi:perosamine synthetase
MIPWAKPTFWGNEKDYILQALNSTWLSGGPFVEKFEGLIADKFNYSFALSTTNGTSAIQATLSALNLKHGDEIIVPGYGFQAAANVALQLGIKPIFVDVDPNTWCIDINSIRNNISKKTRGIVAIHTYGNICEMEEINKISNEYSLPVIEDTAEALGSKFNNTYAGNFERFATLSFQATKTLSTGEGGMVICKSEEDFEKIKLLRSHGMGVEKYHHILAGNNFRLTNLQAALGCAQFEYLDDALEKKSNINKKYVEYLGDISGMVFQKFNSSCEPAVWATGVWIDFRMFKIERTQFIQELLNIGIETRPGFYPASRMKLYETDPLPVSEKIFNGMIVLPSFPELSESEIEFICKSIKNTLSLDND